MGQQEGHEVLQGHRDMLVDGLRRIFGEFDQQMLEQVLPRFEWVELAGGETLFRQGERDDSLYFVISGRLRASRAGEDGSVAVLGDIARGETVGELAFFTGEPRMATISALRDSVLARFSSTVFRELLVAYPLVSLNLTRLVIERMQRDTSAKGRAKPVTLGIAAITQGVDTMDVAHRLAQALGAPGRTVLATAQRVGEWLGDARAAQASPRDVDASRRLVRKLEQVESEHQFVLFVADATPTEWTRRCLRHCDQILLVADATQPPALSAIEESCLGAGPAAGRAASTLVLLHPPGTRVPSGTARWLEPRPHATHIHLRRDAARDWARLGRMVGGNAVGLVLSGGGARGLAHLGVMQALEEAGVEVDMAGGTSIGAIMSSFAAMDIPVAEAIAHARPAFKSNPTSDYNVVPMVSLIAGKRLRRTIDSGIDAIMGPGSRIEDLWKTYFCVSSNYTRTREAVLTRGPLAKSIRASVSIPGALPPVMLDGELHIDGGTFNNFPTDVMAGLGAARIIGVNLLREGGRRYSNIEEVPGPWKLVFDKVRGKRHKLPGLMPLLLNTSIMYSYARQAESKRLVDLYFQPPVYSFGMLDWGKFDRIVKSGYAYARKQLDEGGLPALVASGVLASGTPAGQAGGDPADPGLDMEQPLAA